MKITAACHEARSVYSRVHYSTPAILIPFALAMTLTLLLRPVVDLLQRLHTGRAQSVLLTVLVSIVVAGGIRWINSEPVG